MKTGVRTWIAVLFMLASAAAWADEGAVQVRDPFWPVGYSPSTEATNEVVVVVVPDEEVVKPVTPEEWEAAKARIPRAGGIFVGMHPVSGEMVDKMILGGKTYYAGDQICLTNQFVAFTWKVDSISFKSTKYELSPVAAERVLKGKK